MFGKTVSDLQSGVTIGNDSIGGTLKYVADYTGFSGTASEQSGNYLVVKFAIPGVDTSKYTLQAGLIGGDHDMVTLDSDGIIILRIKNTNQKVKVVATADELPAVTKVYSLANLVLEAAE